MTPPDTPERVPHPVSRRDRLFDEALALPPGERAAFLERNCAGDPALRNELASLLEAHEASDGFFERLSRDWVSPLRSAGVTGDLGASPRLPPGSQVSRYEIVEVLGEGGMGVVYRARDARLERDVALKVLPPEATGDPAARAGLLEEARRVARLDHPHVGVIHEVGETDDAGVYLAMACHEGETLADRLRRGPLPLPSSEVLRIGRGIASALEAAHAAGIVHRDVKPSNVLLTRGGGIRLVDFGIAAAVGEAAAPRGSRGYASPELMTGEPADLRTDLWSLGVLLHEMTTGVRPPPPPKGLPALDTMESGRTLPAGLVLAIRTCLAPDPGDRPRGAEAVAAMLGEDTRAADLPGSLPAKRSRRRLMKGTGSRSGVWTQTWPWAFIGILGVALVLVLHPRADGTGAEESGPTGASPWGESHRVLVLPFEDRTGDAALARVGSMAADWITEGIAGAGIANVVDAGAALTLVRDARNPVEAASVYRAALVVTGAYYLERDSVRLVARIVDGAQGTLVRALEPLAAPREDPLAGIEPLRQAALTALALHLDARTTRHEILVTHRPPPWEAYLAYLRGKDHFIENRMADAREEFVLAEAMDPEFYLAIFFGAIAATNLGDLEDAVARRDRLAPHTHLVNRTARMGIESLDAILAGDLEASYRTHRRGVDEGILAPGTMGYAQLVLDAVTLGHFREAISLAAEADPMRGEVRGWITYWSSLALAHHALGAFEEELEVARRAREAMGLLRHDPLYLEARARVALGDLAGVESVVEEAVRMHPRPSTFLLWTGNHLVIHGHEDEGVGKYREAVARARGDRDRDPTPDGDFLLAEALLSLAAAMGSEGREEALEARTLYGGLMELNPHFIDPPAGLGRAAALLGDTVEARRWSDHLAGVDPQGRFGNHTWRRARIAALLGEPEELAALLEQAFREGIRVHFAAREDPLVMAHRDHPRVAALLRGR